MKTYNKIKILTDHGDPECFKHVRKRILLKNSTLSRFFLKSRVVRELIWGFKCWIISLFYSKSVPIVTYGTGHGFVFAYLQYIFKFIFKPRTHVIFDALWEKRKRKGFAGFMEKFMINTVKHVVDLCIVWGKADVVNFSNEYELPKEKFLFYHYHTTLEYFNVNPIPGKYIFAGGNSQRDYFTLIEAVKNINYPVFIATMVEGIANMASSYPHIVVKAVTPAEFRDKMAGCSIFVECHAQGFLRTGGHQTMLNAMWLGKPVVLADENSALGYIVDGENGLVVNIGDIENLRNKINLLISDSSLCQRIAKKGQMEVQKKEYSPVNVIQYIYNTAITIHCKKLGVGYKDRHIELY